MKKKTLKVKNKIVKYKTKKKVKKKKKIIKKIKVKRKRRKKFLMKDLYPLLNRVQLKRKTIKFVTETIESAIVENTIKDLGLIYSKKEMKTQVEFTVKPNEEDIFNSEEDILDIEYLDDEIPEIDQIFP